MRAFQIDVALVPAFVENDPDRRKSVVHVVVDVIRATTTLAVAFDRGCRRVLLAPDIETALERAQPRAGTLPAGWRARGRRAARLRSWQLTRRVRARGPRWP